MDVRTLLLEMNTKLSSLLSLPEKVDGIEKSIEMLSAEFDRFTVRLDAQEKETKQLKAHVVSLEQASDMKLIAEMQAEIDDLEWRSRRLNLEFHGIPKTEPEDLLSKINEIAAQFHLDTLDTQDVAAVHRLPSRPDRIPGVIVRFTRQEAFQEQIISEEDKRIVAATQVGATAPSGYRLFLLDFAGSRGPCRHHRAWDKRGLASATRHLATEAAQGTAI
ncbi:hypothetical protein HPB52_023257 [Rhipicephalus sanguineus]|uniref:Zinc finger DNA binding protein n=1 Tax=Rhipicephalus sanguineus TaxID=34632 RepID=A0A9D4PZ48_RHISA|nr:hypothetical protein HPB52_023257 [Rhipicephalus sanguineus]